MKSQSGFSLIEVMLSTALGLFLIGGFIQIYLTVEKTFNLQQAITQIQENGRFAVHFLRERILMAGYEDCGASPSFVNADLAIQGYRNTLPGFLQSKALTNTDSVVIGRCEVDGGVMQFKQVAFFIGATNRKNKLGKTIYALYEMPVGDDKRELVSGISHMKINYGVATLDGADVLQYLSADNVVDWKKIKAVDIALLLDSETPVLSKPASYLFAGKNFSPDRFLHRQWHTYIALREL